jgi:MFS family permease
MTDQIMPIADCSDPAARRLGMAGNGEMKRGWRIILAASLGVGTGLSPLPFYTIGVFIRPLSQAFGWTAEQILRVLVVTTLTVVVASPGVGLLTEKFGVRRVTLISTTGFGLCFLLFAFNTGSLWLFYATYALLALIGAGTLPITWTRAVNSWFRERRGFALGLSLLLTGVFGSLAQLYTNWMVDFGGWRIAYAGLSAFPLVIAFCHERKEPAGDALPRRETEPGLTLKRALATRPFWTIVIALILITVGVGGIIPNLIPLMGSKGIDHDTSVKLASIIGFAVLVGRPVGGWLIDRFWAPGVAFFILAAPALAFFVMSQGSPPAPALAACVFLIGFASGVEYDVIAYLVSRYFGMRSYSAIYGCLYVAFGLGAGFAPTLIARAYAAQKSYDPTLLVLAALLVAGAALLLTLGRYPVFGREQADDAPPMATGLPRPAR